MTPGEHKGRKHANAVPCVWEKNMISGMLSDEQYIGTYVAGKRRTAIVGSKQTIKVPESEWVKIPNHHPAIIDISTFRAVREASGRKSEPLRKRKLGTSERYGNPASLLKGKVICGCCGHAMRISSTKNPQFHCNYTRTAPSAECHGLKRATAELESAVFEAIQRKVKPEHGELAAFNEGLSSLTECGRRIARIGDEKRTLYEKLMLGEVTPEEYKEAKSGLDDELVRLSATNAALAAQSSEHVKTAKATALAAKINAAHSLTQELTDLTLDKVLVFPDGRVEVR
jgi:hypothetical protein